MLGENRYCMVKTATTNIEQTIFSWVKIFAEDYLLTKNKNKNKKSYAKQSSFTPGDKIFFQNREKTPLNSTDL